MKKGTPHADIRWIPEFQEKYAVWFREVKTLLDTHQYPAAFKTYPFPAFEQTPWAPFRVPLMKGCLGIVSTTALSRRNIDAPFSDHLLHGNEGSERLSGIRDMVCGDLETLGRDEEKDIGMFPHDLRDSSLMSTAVSCYT